MNKAIRDALFCSTLLGMGVLFGLCIAYFGRQYAKEQVKASRNNRKRYTASITQDDGWAK